MAPKSANRNRVTTLVPASQKRPPLTPVKVAEARLAIDKPQSCARTRAASLATTAVSAPDE